MRWCNLVLRCFEFFHFWFPVLPQSSSRIPCKKRPKLNVAGELARRSPLLCIHRKTFFFLFLKCFTSAVSVPVMVQVSPWSLPTVFFTCVPGGQSILWSLPLTSQFDLRALLLVTLLVVHVPQSLAMPCRGTTLLPSALEHLADITLLVRVWRDPLKRRDFLGGVGNNNMFPMQEMLMPLSLSLL